MYAGMLLNSIIQFPHKIQKLFYLHFFLRFLFSFYSSYFQTIKYRCNNACRNSACLSFSLFTHLKLYAEEGDYSNVVFHFSECAGTAALVVYPMFLLFIPRKTIFEKVFTDRKLSTLRVDVRKYRPWLYSGVCSVLYSPDWITACYGNTSTVYNTSAVW